jgi:hypothetical protein
MDTKLSCAAVSILLALTGCGAEATLSVASTTPAPALSMAEAPSQPSTGLLAAAPTNVMPSEPAIDPNTLPAAPWTNPPLPAREAPRPILNAWREADNRDTCAPIAPRSFGAAEGARGRSSHVAGGWVVEFDRPGLPGVDRDGNECDDCGRSVFGVAGTSMMPEELLGPDAEITPPTFSDGSHAVVEVSDGDGESVASVTFTVAGQGCVYEVWSFLGPAHLEELVSELRMVEPPAERGTAVARAD